MYIATVSNADQKVNAYDKKRVPKKVMSTTFLVMSAKQTFVSRIIGMRLQGIFFGQLKNLINAMF